MNKKGIIKISTIILILALLLVFIFSSFFSSASSEESYLIGEEIKIDLSNYDSCIVKLKTPSGEESQSNCDNKFFLKFEEVGQYVLDIKSEDNLERLEFQVNSAQMPFEEITTLVEEEISTISNEEESSYKRNESELIIIGKPVKNSEILKLEELQTIKIKVPENAEEILIKDNFGEELLFKEKETVVNSIENVFKENNEKSLIILNAEGEINIEYLTPGPEKIEENISENEKQVKVFSEEGLHYENVLSYTELPSQVSDISLIKLYWVENSIYLDFEAKDTDGDGLLDYIEWIVPHLSEQTFDITISISKAQHLNSDRETIISDIYDSVKKLDDIWSEKISEGEYVRITFERNLTKENDITIYARSNESGTIEVYEKNSNVKIADFKSIGDSEEYKILLTNLMGVQDTFDLKIVGGSVEFDYIVDPLAIYNSTVGAPRCLNSTSPCIANSSLLRCAGSQSSPGPESNQPNTIDTCTDASTIGTCHSDESVENITVTDVNRSTFTQGDTINVTVVWYCYGTMDRIALYYTNSTSSIAWKNKLVGTTTCTAAGYHTRNISFKLDNVSGEHAVRAIMLYNANINSACPTGDYRDQDDLAFQVSALASDAPPNVTLSFPSNNYVNNTHQYVNINFNASITDDKNIVNCSLWTNYSGTWSLNQTQTLAGTLNVTNFTINSLTNKTFIWNIKCYDNASQSSFGSVNRTVKLNYTYTPETALANQIQCEEGSSWKDCNQIHFGDTITRVRVNCTGVIQNANFNLMNTPDNSTLFNSNSTSNESTWWIYNNNDLIINDSGEFVLGATCYGPSSQSSNLTRWNITWGNLTIDLINPDSNINVNPNEFFNFTTKVTCTGGECGFVNVTLDPAGSWWNLNYENRKLINITNPSSSILVQNYSMIIIVDTTGINFQDDGDDLRIVYWNGTTNVELDSYNDTSFNSTSTSLWFRIQSNISGGNYNDNYYIYYNNTDAINPPRNGSKVFEFFEDFNRANSGTIGNGWAETTGTWAILSNKVRNTYDGDSDLTRATIIGNHSIRVVVNHETSDADWKLMSRMPSASGDGYSYGYQNNQLQITTGTHDSSNLGTYSYTPTIENDYEIELNNFGSRITAYLDNSLIFNISSTTYSSGVSGIHAWATVQFDDFWIRKLLDIEPNYSLGNAEKRTKGIISMANGASPFYTTSNNPMNYLGTSCLANMKSGNTCNITWSVNATGKIGSIWEFFAYANNTNYTNYFNVSDSSSHINITIGNLPPTIPELNFPINNTALTSIEEFNWSNSADPTGDSIYYIFEISNSSNFSYIIYRNSSISQQEEITGDTPIGITQEGMYYWRVLSTDLQANSSWSETRIFYYDTSNPTINLIFPEDSVTNITSNTLDFIYNISDLSDIASCSLIINDSINSSSTNITKNTNLTFTVFLPNSFYSWKINCTDTAGGIGTSATRYLNVDVSNNPPVA
ncbi:MAG: DUF2341 domain-containing protein, partial [archaeon]